MKKSKALLFITILVYIFLIGPLLVIMAASFSNTTYLKFPGEGFTLQWYEQIIKVKSFKRGEKQCYHCVRRYVYCSHSGTSSGLRPEPVSL